MSNSTHAVHNPENVPASALPPGFRFMYEDEPRTLELLRSLKVFVNEDDMDQWTVCEEPIFGKLNELHDGYFEMDWTFITNLPDPFQQPLPAPEVYNPEEIPEDALPKGFRFATKEEVLNPKLLEHLRYFKRNYNAGLNAYTWELAGKASDSALFGGVAPGSRRLLDCRWTFALPLSVLPPTPFVVPTPQSLLPRRRRRAFNL